MSSASVPVRARKTFQFHDRIEMLRASRQGEGQTTDGADLEKAAGDDKEVLKGALFQTPMDEAYSRFKWLLGLLLFQSTSSFVLERYQELIQENLVITLFLTMLVGAGGNAGNQSAIKVITGLATKQIDGSFASFARSIKEQVLVGSVLGSGLFAVGFARVYLTNGDTTNALAIAMALFFIVEASTVLGTCLPYALHYFGVDPSNAGTSIQVIMDILGVSITCWTCTAVFQVLAHAPVAPA